MELMTHKKFIMASLGQHIPLNSKQGKKTPKQAITVEVSS
jgi:hypothetical protein